MNADKLRKIPLTVRAKQGDFIKRNQNKRRM